MTNGIEGVACFSRRSATLDIPIGETQTRSITIGRGSGETMRSVRPLWSSNHRTVPDGRTFRAGTRKLSVRWIKSDAEGSNGRVEGRGPLGKCSCLRDEDSLRLSTNGPCFDRARPNLAHLLVLNTDLLPDARTACVDEGDQTEG